MRIDQGESPGCGLTSYRSGTLRIQQHSSSFNKLMSMYSVLNIGLLIKVLGRPI